MTFDDLIFEYLGHLWPRKKSETKQNLFGFYSKLLDFHLKMNHVVTFDDLRISILLTGDLK